MPDFFRRPSVHKKRGFTLLEVLVALAIASFALVALWKVLGQGIFITGELPDRVLAGWVAHNHIVMRQATGHWPDTGIYEGHEEMAGITWYWKEEVETTSEPQLRRITIKVGEDVESRSLVTLEGFIRQFRPQ